MRLHRASRMMSATTAGKSQSVKVAAQIATTLREYTQQAQNVPRLMHLLSALGLPEQ